MKEISKSTKYLLILTVLDLVIAYIFGSLAIDSGSYWHYLFTIVFLTLGVKNLMRTFKNHGKS